MTSRSGTSPSEARAESPVAAHPAFAAAIRNSTASPLAMLDEDPRFLRCIGDIPTYALGVLALHLHAIDRLYHRGLRDVARDLFSAGRASAILARMQATGLIVPEDAFQSGRQRRYRPAPAMVEAFRALYLIELKSLALIDPRVAGVVEAYDGSAVFDRIVAFLATRQLAAPTLDADLVDPLGGVGRRAMGVMLAYSLADSAFRAGLPRAAGEIDLNLTHLAIRLGVSRTHARRTVTMLQDVGLVAPAARPNRLILTPAFADGLELYFNGMFSILLAALAQPEVSPPSATPAAGPATAR